MRKNYALLKLPILFFIGSIVSSVQAQTPEQDGQWSDPIPFGIVPVAVANLPDGKLITWSSKFRDTYTEMEDGMTYTEIFDPTLGTDGQALGETVTQTNHDMFCPGINNLADGRILSAGGTSSERTSIYDPVTGIWSRAADMNVNRGYQGNVTLADGSVFTVGGSWSGSNTVATNGGKNAELYTPSTGWINLPNIEGEDIFTANDLAKELQGPYRVDNHVWLWPAPNGKIFHAGPGEMMHWIEPDIANGGSISDAGLRGTDTYSMKGTTVMFDIGKILKVGGAESYGSSDPAFVPAKDNSMVIDINDENNVTVTATVNNLSFARTMHNSTVLPDGKVLVTGGLDKAEVFSDTGARLTAELYDPATNSWSNVAGMAIPRTYHSVSILLTDGRVFVGGGGLCDTSNLDECVNHMDAEIYSPPYLFTAGGALATRPTISAPATSDYDTNISVTGTNGINGFSLIRFSAATHSTNNEQRRIPVGFTEDTPGNYTVSIPNRELLPPGNYMLFALDINGVPSVAETINIGSDVPLSINPNLILDLSFDETSGSTANDGSLYNNDATIYDVDNDAADKTAGTHTWDTGVFGGAIAMDGFEFQSNTIIEVPYSASMATIQDAVTVMAWVNRADIDFNVGILSHDYPQLFFGFHNSMYKWDFPTDTGGRADCYAGYSPLNTWVHIAATYDGQTARLFANGVEICTQAVSGDFNLNSAEANFSAFTASGFYQRDPNVVPSYNGSGVTDEINGKIDEFKVFNKALGAQEIQAFFELGQAQGVGVPVCPDGTITAEYKIGNGAWIAGNNINVPEGSEVFIRAQATGEYLVTVPEVDSDTFSSLTDFTQTNGYKLDTGTKTSDNDGTVSATNEGQYVLTTVGGCAVVINLNVTGSCDPGDTQVQAEWRIGTAPYQNGNIGEDVNITADEGQNVRLSLLPNVKDSDGTALRFDVTTPSGAIINSVFGDYRIDGIKPSDAGNYILESEEGCSLIITVDVNAFDCGTVETEYRINGTGAFITGQSTLSIEEGNELLLSIIPNGNAWSLSGPNGHSKPEDFTDYTIPSLTTADSGLYTFTTITGCEVTLDVTVTAVDCSIVETEYEINDSGDFIEGATEVTVVIGSDLLLSIIPNGTPYSIAGPNGNDKTMSTSDLVITDIAADDAGTYTFTTQGGCIVTLDVIVNSVDCDALGLVTEYRIDTGLYVSGETVVTVNEGSRLDLSILPNGVPFSIDGPNGNNKAESVQDLTISSMTIADGGTYTFTTNTGCEVTLLVGVDSSDCTALNVQSEYTIDGGANVTGQSQVSLPEGSTLLLSIIPDGIPYSIAGANGNDKPADLSDLTITNIAAADAGTYTFLTTMGCSTSIEVLVTDPCPPGSFTPEYTLDGTAGSGDSSISVELGTPVSLGVVQGGTFEITQPNGTKTNGVLDLGNIALAQAGDYVFTSSVGCMETLTIVVVDPCTAANFAPEYTIDGIPGSGNATITVDEDTPVVLGLVQDGVEFSITAPDNSTTVGDLDLGNVALSQAGDYVYSSPKGCAATVTIVVNASDPCPAGSFTPEYSVGGAVSNGESSITVDAGTPVILGIVQDTGFTITDPNNVTTTGNLDLGNIIVTQAGNYVFTSDAGCTAELLITVNALPAIGLDDVKLFPNPTTDGTLSFGLENFMNERMFISFFNIHGRLMFQETVPDNHAEVVTVDVSSLSSGTYLVEIRRSEKDENTIKKVIKRR